MHSTLRENLVILELLHLRNTNKTYLWKHVGAAGGGVLNHQGVVALHVYNSDSVVR